MNPLQFIDLFAGLGGFHRALEGLGHECVFASEIDEELRGVYLQNFPIAHSYLQGDIRESKTKVPSHDVLCAGFPCQPFSKSGSQRGMRDETRGTLFHDIVEILEHHRPQYLILENVGNFERHDNGRTWRVVRDALRRLGYDIRGTEHVNSGGPGLLSPHHLGFPHTRERFFIVGSLKPLPAHPFPKANRSRVTNLERVVRPTEALSARDWEETRLSPQQIDCINHWNELLQRLPAEIGVPSFPIWGDEIRASYPFEKKSPFASPIAELRRSLPRHSLPTRPTKEDLLALLPSYARTEEAHFPKWKIAFIRQNREWFKSIRRYISNDWIDKLETFPSSLRKLEWNCHGEPRDLWRYVLQFRPSGLRVKRYSASPALVAMTSTQIPILGPRRRFLTRAEALRLQGFPSGFRLPQTRDAVFRALGNAVHVGVVRSIAQRLLRD